MVTVTLYTRKGCHLCDEARSIIDAVARDVRFAFEVIDIDDDPALAALYTDEVPVVAVAGRKAFKYRLTAPSLRDKILRSQGPA